MPNVQIRPVLFKL